MRDWAPDEMVTAAVLDGRYRYADLSAEDARWVVADLTHRGHSAHDIADWLACSARQVKRLRADLSTRVMAAWIDCSEKCGEAERELWEMRRHLLENPNRYA